MAMRGRPPKLDKDLLVNVIVKYKDAIILNNNKVISKTNIIWQTIAKELKNEINPYSLYTFVICNRYGVRNQLTDMNCSPACDDFENSVQDVSEKTTSDSITDESTFNNSDTYLHHDRDMSVFMINIPKEDFDSIIIYKKYRRNEKGRSVSTRNYTILQPGIWQQILTEKIWQNTKLPCGFKFKKHKLTNDGKSGYAYGSCNCGSIIKCEIDNSGEIITKIKCKFIKGEGSCGKRYLRDPIRKIIAEKVRDTCAMQYRVEMAEKYMETDDNTEPPHLYSANVLRVAKHNLMQNNYLNKDPIKSIELMKLGSLQNVIHGIGLNPFFVHYWTNFQLHVYRKYASNEAACVYIDATGSIVKKIKRSDKSKSSHIFLYNCVAGSENNRLFPVCQMLSEMHNTNAISYWLAEWIRSGAPRPREVVCDFSRALLTAAVQSFTGYQTLEDYADACNQDSVPCTYIRIDVAHFIKKYSNFLKDLRKNIKQFYLCLLGQLILSKNVHVAEDIIFGILIIARSETEGDTQEGKKTICEEFKIKFKNLIAKQSTQDIEDTLENCNNIPDEEESGNTNRWNEWANNINNSVTILLNELPKGDRDNAHYMPKFADYLVKDLKLLPLWSCVHRDTFGYGRIPASSARVESDFNIIKNIMLKCDATPIRADEFISKHISFINGRLKLHNVDIPENNNIEQQEIIYNEGNKAPRTNTNNCPACRNDAEPTGAHTCYICNKNVHALEECSIAYGEEGYGQQRICAQCQKINNIGDILSSKQVENWRGLVKKSAESKGKYLKKLISNDILLEAVHKIPIIKNGANMSLKSVQIGKNVYSFTNTCAFDSVLQLFIAAYYDRNTIKDFVINEKEFKFFELVSDAISNGIRKSSYRLRAMILKEIFPITNSLNNCVLINCEVTVAFLCKKLFDKYPSFREISKCGKGCPQREKSLPLIQVKLPLLLNNEIPEIERDFTIQGLRFCCTPGCDGMESTIISHVGKCIVIELYTNLSEHHNGSECAIQLKNIPKSIQFSFMEECYTLLGIVNLTAPGEQTRKSADRGIGHYTAIACRRGYWIQYDDCKDTDSMLNENYVSNPHMLIYTQT